MQQAIAHPLIRDVKIDPELHFQTYVMVWQNPTKGRQLDDGTEHESMDHRESLNPTVSSVGHETAHTAIARSTRVNRFSR